MQLPPALKQRPSPGEASFVSALLLTVKVKHAGGVGVGVGVGVVVGVGVGVGEGGISPVCSSNAPISTMPFAIRVNPTPR